MSDPNLAFLNKFIELYQELVSHDGYGDMQVAVRLVQGRNKEVSLQCGREYRFQIGNPNLDKRPKRYKAVNVRGNRHGYNGPERRSGKDRRELYDRRQKRSKPFQFRLERRLDGDRRAGRGRRKDD